MDFLLFFDKINLASEGRKTFFDIHKRAGDSVFANEVRAAREAFDKSDDAFAEEIAAFAERENLQVEYLNLYLYVVFAEEAFAVFKRRRISEDIFYSTFFDITIVCRVCEQKCGVYVIPQDIYRDWLRLPLMGKLYRLGRLQFELIESEYDLPEYGLRRGDTCLSTHIPRYEPLDNSLCEESYAAARVFFKEKFGIERCVFFCDSWLLHPWLREDLPADSRIRVFSEKFSLLKVTESREEVLNWIFPFMDGTDVSTLPGDTFLRRAAIARMLENRPLGSAIGVRE